MRTAASSDQRRIVLVRHGETVWSSQGRHTSATDVALTQTGLAQAQRVGRALAGRAFGLVLSSPRLRALQTARLAGFPDPVVDADLAEWDYGALEGRTTAELSAELGHPWNIWTAASPDPVPAETAQAVGERCDRVIARLQADAADAVVFAHAHLLRILASRWLGLPALEGQRLALGTGSVSELGFEHGVPVVWRWNLQP